MKESLIKYIDYLKYNKKYSKHTINSYYSDLTKFFLFLKKEAIINLKEVNHKTIKLFLIELNQQQLAVNSISRMIATLRGFFKYLSTEKIIIKNPMTLIANPKHAQRLPNFLYYNELISLLKSIDLISAYGKRNYLIIELLYSTGIRVSELISIKLTDFNLEKNELKILGKGNKERIVYFGEQTHLILNDYLEEARDALMKNKKHNFLFINNLGNQLTERGVRLILNKVVKDSGLDIKISPHILRHTFATHLLNEGADIITVKELLGHDSLNSTSIYTHITNQKLKEEYLKYHPRSKKNN